LAIVGLGLETQVLGLGLGLGTKVLGLGLGLDGHGLGLGLDSISGSWLYKYFTSHDADVNRTLLPPPAAKHYSLRNRRDTR